MGDVVCDRCGAPMGRRGVRCPSCGAAAGELVIEPLDADGEDNAQDIVLGRSHRSRRRDALMVAAGVVLLGGAAFVVGRGGQNPSAAPVPTTVPISTTTPGTTVPATTAVPTTQVTPTTLAATFTTTLSEGPLTVSAAGIPAFPRALVLYAVDAGTRSLLRVEFDAGVVHGRRLLRLPGSPDEPLSVIGRADGAVIVPTWSNLEGLWVPDRSDEITRYVGQGDGLVQAATDPNLLWRIVPSDFNGAGPGATVVDVTGVPMGPERNLPGMADPLGDDGTGGLLLAGSPGTFRLDPLDGSIRRIDAEPAVAWNAARLVTITCDDQLMCHFRLVDRTTGEATLGALVPDGLHVPSYWPILGGLDPTGTRVARIDGALLEVVELATGATTRVIASNLAGFGSGRLPFVWSPDGQWLFWADGGRRIMALQVGASEPIPITITGAEHLGGVSVAPPTA